MLIIVCELFWNIFLLEEIFIGMNNYVTATIMFYCIKYILIHVKVR